MQGLTRRDCVKATMAMMAGSGAAPLLSASTPKPAHKGGGIKLCEVFGPGQTQRLRLAKQIGVNYAILTGLSALAKVPSSQYLETLQKIKAEFDQAGIKIAGVESHPVPAEKIKLGLPGRDQEIENYKAVIEALSKVGIPMICYNFMAGLGWYRTKVDVPERGGALTTEFDNEVAKKEGLTQWGEISEEKMWANMEYFIKAVMPVADKYNIKMALHPDDPPITPLRGIARVVINAKNYRRVMDMYPSPVNGVTFCQANFKAMGEDPEALAKEWCKKKKIFFVHFRDIEGQGQRFRETFHDNGPTNMARMLQVYTGNGFDGPMRPDHAPTLEGESNSNPGYAMTGKVFAFGYMKGIMDALNLPYD